jgi:hypothetical protein
LHHTRDDVAGNTLTFKKLIPPQLWP